MKFFYPVDTSSSLALLACLFVLACLFWVGRGGWRTGLVGILGAALWLQALKQAAIFWTWTGLYFPLLFWVPFLFLADRSLSAGRGTRSLWRVGLAWVLILSGASAQAKLWQCRHFEGPAVEAEFPLKGGDYWVLNGGNGSLVNAHDYAGTTNRLALDIVKKNAWGRTAKVLDPRRMEDFNIFGETVYCPCSGQVFRVRSEVPDVWPFKEDGDFMGNYVVVECGEGTMMMLVHLMQDSAAVKQGEKVAAGQVLGRVGNSGRSGLPHLHFQATRGKGQESRSLPVTFKGIFPIRNDVVKN